MNYLSSFSEINSYLRDKGFSGSFLFLDTCIFALLVVGISSNGVIEGNGLSNGLTNENFKILLSVIKLFGNKVAITPHVLTETYRHLREYFPKTGENMLVVKLIEKIKETQEIYIDSGRLTVEIKNFETFGPTDLSLIEAARTNGRSVIFTNEWPLYLKFSTVVPIIKLSTVIAQEKYPVANLLS